MKRILVFLLAFAVSGACLAQLPLVDKGVQVEGIWCFPVHGDSLTYVYLPYQASLATNEAGLPQFSYMRYVMNKPTAGSTEQSIEEADGGALLNFLVLYNTAPEAIETAQQALRRRLKNDSVRLVRPIVFNSGRYSLVSTALSGDSLVRKRQLLYTGPAPVLENSRLALSFGLTPFTSKLLLENFQMSTPDVSLVFDMEFAGLSDDYDATLDVDWSEVKQSFGLNFGFNYYVAADIKLAFDELMKKQAIKLTVNGSNQTMDGLLQVVYDKLLNMMFQPVQPEQLPPQQQTSLLTALSGMMGGGGGGAIVNIGFQMKSMNMTGKSRLYFKGRNAITRHHYITFNIGNLYQQYGANKALFRDVPMTDQSFLQRRVVIGMDGEMDKEFDKILNSVTVFLSKEHQNGQVTNESLLISKANKNSQPSFVYGYQDDAENWLQYRHRAVWQFKGGATDTTGWVTQDAAMINLYVPFRRRTIQLEGDVSQLAAKGIRALSVQISYPFFSTVKQERITVSTTSPKAGLQFEITQPNNHPEIDYVITWVKSNGDTVQSTGKDKLGIIFIDDLPSF